MLLLLNASYWHDPISEKPARNSTEIWSFINPTDDTHPIHLHAVRFQILDRQHYEPWPIKRKRSFVSSAHARRPSLTRQAGKTLLARIPRW